MSDVTFHIAKNRMEGIAKPPSPGASPADPFAPRGNPHQALHFDKWHPRRRRLVA
jgi:hypothetical protein